MESQRRIVLAGATLDDDVVGLLETDAVPVVIAHCAIADHSAESAIQKDAAAATTVEMHILVLIALDDEVFDLRTGEVVTADHREDGGRLGAIVHHAIGVQ